MLEAQAGLLPRRKYKTLDKVQRLLLESGMTAFALVEGGTSGIGRKIASTLFSRGEEVVISGRDLARAESVSDEIGKNANGAAALIQSQ
jgi:short-subunit dehydrogenase